MAFASSFKTHLFDLPVELLYKIFQKLDTQSVESVSKVCMFLNQSVMDYRNIFKDYIERQRLREQMERSRSRFAMDELDSESEDYDDVDDDVGGDIVDDDLDYLVDEMLDRRSQGSNYEGDSDDDGLDAELEGYLEYGRAIGRL